MTRAEELAETTLCGLTQSEWMEWQAKRDRFAADAEALAEALDRYGRHEYSCAAGERTAHGGAIPGDCDCGFDAALARYRGEK